MPAGNSSAPWPSTSEIELCVYLGIPMYFRPSPFEFPPFSLCSFQLDRAGCARCLCRESACHSVRCPREFVCRMVPRKCRTLPSAAGGALTACAIPECHSIPLAKLFAFGPLGLPNVCVQGEPLEEATSGELVQCDERAGIQCPRGWYCQQMGMGPMGYCCRGLGTVATRNRECPPLMPHPLPFNKCSNLNYSPPPSDALRCPIWPTNSSAQLLIVNPFPMFCSDVV